MRERLLSFLVTVVLLGVLTSGCGGGGDTGGTEGATGTAAGATTTAAASTATAAGPAVQKLPVPREFEATKNTPEFFERLLSYERPIFLWFYRSDDSVSQNMKGDIEAIEANPDYLGVIYRKVDIDRLGKWADLAGELNVGFVPHLFVFDREGLIIFDQSGFIDGKSMENAVYDALNYRHKPAPKQSATPAGPPPPPPNP